MCMYYADVAWCIADIRRKKPSCSDEEIADWLDKHEDTIRENMIGTGWEVIQSIMEDEQSRAEAAARRKAREQKDAILNTAEVKEPVLRGGQLPKEDE